MKNIYNLLKRVIVMLIAITGLATQAGTFNPHPQSSPKYTLYPPTNLQVVPIEACYAYLTWAKPHDPGGLNPAGLLGYRFYRDSLLIHYIADPDSLSYFDFIDFAGSYTDSITAWYDITSYGFPGDFGESSATSANSFSSCGEGLPFFEPWTGGSFSYQMWTFLPDQGNWFFNTIDGNPTPTASFSGTPAVTNYDNTLRSIDLSGTGITCADFYVEFDSRVIVNNPTSQEKLIIEVYYDYSWVQKDTLVNNSSTGWVHHKIDITDVAGKVFWLGFRATGINSADIGEWDVDNIYVYYVCFKPPNFNLERTGHQVHLSWGKPCTGKMLTPDQVDIPALSGYNVYRTDSTGLPPFMRINVTYVADTNYTDMLPATFTGSLCYYVTAVYQDTNNPGHIYCEPPSDTLCTEILSGVQVKNEGKIHIFPNPVSDVLNIESDKPFTSIEILNFTGEKIYSDSFPEIKNITFPMKNNLPGIYLVKINLRDRIVVRKIVKS
jgi:hypothetical protein